MKTTLNEIRKHHPCQDGWEKLLRYLNKTKPDDEPLPLLTVLQSNGLEDALWCFRAVEGFDREKRLLAVAFAREVEHLMPEASKPALAVAERFANGLATEEELAQARSAAAAAARSAADARSAAWAADAAAAYADARSAARSADAAAAYAAAWAAARSADAAYAAWAADVADAAAAATTYKAACSEMQAKQTQILRKFLEEQETL